MRSPSNQKPKSQSNRILPARTAIRLAVEAGEPISHPAIQTSGRHEVGQPMRRANREWISVRKTSTGVRRCYLLPGRAGMDLNLTLFYNSLVWTKEGSYMKF